ncbi:MAG: hypothetical protein QW809_05295 [Sulfolobales archaeon]
MMVGIYGFGSIGRLIAEVTLERGYDIVGVVDVDENIIGKDVGEVLGIKSLGIEISRDIYVLSDADVVIHATDSYLDKVFNQITSIVEMGIHVVSTCETLAYPYYRYPILALQLDELAKDYGVSVIGTGINPGFILDTLVVAISSSVTSIVSIKAVRSIDAAKRRESLSKENWCRSRS